MSTTEKRLHRWSVDYVPDPKFDGKYCHGEWTCVRCGQKKSKINQVVPGCIGVEPRRSKKQEAVDAERRRIIADFRDWLDANFDALPSDWYGFGNEFNRGVLSVLQDLDVKIKSYEEELE